MLYHVGHLPLLLLLLHTTSDGLPVGEPPLKTATTGNATVTATIQNTDDCEFTQHNPVTKDGARLCVDKMNREKDAHPKILFNLFLDLSSLTEKEAKPLLTAKKIKVSKMAVKDTDWKVFRLWPGSIDKTSSKPFMLLLENMYQLERIEINWNSPFTTTGVRGYGITIVNCPKLEQKHLAELAKYTVNHSFPLAGACSGSIRKECKSYNGTNLLIDEKTIFEGPPTPAVIPEGSCLSIVNSSLKTMAFIQLPKNPVTGCKIKFMNNLELCPSRKDVIAYNFTYGFSLPGNASANICTYSELSNAKKKCHILRGAVVIEGDSLSESVYKKLLGEIYEIRDGHLIIRNTTRDYLSWLTHLIRIDSSHDGFAIRIENTNISSWTLPLISIRGERPSQKTIVFENNPGLQLTAEQEKTLTVLTDGNWVLIRPTSATTRKTGSSSGTVITSRPATTSRTVTITEDSATVTTTEDSTTVIFTTTMSEEDRKAADHQRLKEMEDKETKLSVPVLTVFILVFVVLPLFAVLVFYICWRRARRFHLTPIPKIPPTKRNLLLNLAQEILEMNPLEWRQLVHHEAKTGGRLTAEEELKLRSQYSKFVEEAEKSHIVFNVHPPPDTNKLELFQIFKQFYDETRNKTHLILLSRHSDPAKTCPLLVKNVGSAENVVVHEKLTMKAKSKSKDTSTTTATAAQGGQYELLATLKSSTPLDLDIELSKYKMSMSQSVDGSPWKANYTLSLVHYHEWTEERVRDATKILKLIAYGKNRTGCKKLLQSGMKRPVFLTSSSSQSYVVMMLTAVLYHVTDPTYPAMRLSEMRQLVFLLLGFSYALPESILCLFQTILSWAAEEKCIPVEKLQAYEDFLYIMEKISAYKSINPTTLFYETGDLNLAEDVNQRVESSQILKKLLETEAISTDQNMPLETTETTVESGKRAKPKRNLKSKTSNATLALDKTIQPSTEKMVQKTMPPSSTDKQTQRTKRKCHK